MKKLIEGILGILAFTVQLIWIIAQGIAEIICNLFK